MGFLLARGIRGRRVQNCSLPSLVDIPSHTHKHTRSGCPLVFPHTEAVRTQIWQTNCTICSFTEVLLSLYLYPLSHCVLIPPGLARYPHLNKRCLQPGENIHASCHPQFGLFNREIRLLLSFTSFWLLSETKLWLKVG